MPIQGGDGAFYGLLDVLGHPPVVLRVKVADGDETCARADGKLVFAWAPLDAGCRSVDPQQHQGVLPLAIRLEGKKGGF